MNFVGRFVLTALVLGLASAHGAALKKDYFAASTPGAWAAYTVTFTGGGKSTQHTQRLPDEDGHIVVAESVKVLAGSGAGAESKNISTLPKDFAIARDWLSHGKFTEKMKMEFSGTQMTVDENTLAAIRKSSKDFRDALTFEAAETVEGRACDRFAYSIPDGGDAKTHEEGRLWLDPSVPFGIVRHTGSTRTEKGEEVYAFDVRLQEFGAGEKAAAVEATAPVEAPALPAVVGLVEGYKAERYALEISVVASTRGRKLHLALKNKGAAALTVKLRAGDIDIPADSPIGTLRITVANDADLAVPAEGSSAPVTVTQRGARGPTEGTFTLSVFEGALLYSGSVTMDKL